MEGVQDYCGINFHVWLSSVYFAGIEFREFAEKPRNHQIFHPQKYVAFKYIASLNAV